ncbi:hypothetical protein L2U69_12525 [Zavarzinia compransoris]|uniref:hypothetical protein n=1 Tax=Zavarzinia marina TaxID=2911065 RepID=UPI001F1E0313|nr:hypothetical protein [Zavarzinia marina]MCF4166471.1 hypothetical protein [Zavarzinia marina]
MAVVDRLTVELAADVAPLRDAFAEADKLGAEALAGLAAAFAEESAGKGAFDGLARGVERAGRDIRHALIDAITGAEVEWDQVLARMALRVSDLLLDDALANALSALTGGGGGGGGLGDLVSALFGGFRASGGPVRPDRAYVVGENGPELFVPDGSGEVVPGTASAAQVMPRVTVNITTPDADSFRRSQGQVTAAMARALAAARRYS